VPAVVTPTMEPPAPIYPRVTEILKACGLGSDLSMVPDDVLTAAQDRGKAVHEAVELMTYGGFDPSTFPPEHEGYLAAWRAFLKDSGYEPKYAEIEVRSERWRFRGHPDNVGFLNMRRTLIDLKSGTFDRVDLQLAGYVHAWNEERPAEPVEAALAVQLRRDGSYRVTEADLGAATPIFLAAVLVHRAQQRSA
jgi:hypothetical protein